jgi:hypothetical protein
MSEEKPKPTIYFVEAIIKQPSPGCWAGQTSHGAFTLVNDTVTLCHPTTGDPVRDPQGKMFTHKLEPPTTTLADAKEHAERLTRECRQALRGGRPRGFGGPGSAGGPKGPIVYPKNTGISDEAPSLHQLGVRP